MEHDGLFYCANEARGSNEQVILINLKLDLETYFFTNLYTVFANNFLISKFERNKGQLLFFLKKFKAREIENARDTWSKDIYEE